VKWGLALFLLAAGFFSHYFFSAAAIPLKIIGWIIILTASAGILLTTQQGKQVIEFAKEARVELRKVVWPSRQEALQIAFIVILMVFIAGLCLWGIDSALIWFIGKMTQLKIV